MICPFYKIGVIMGKAQGTGQIGVIMGREFNNDEWRNIIECDGIDCMLWPCCSGRNDDGQDDE